MARRPRSRHHGGCVHFNSNSAYASCVAPAAIQTRTRTLLAWVRTNAPTPSVLPFFSLGAANYYFGLSTGGTLIASYADGSSTQQTPISSAGVVSSSMWTRVAFVIDSTGAPNVATSFFANGAQVGTTAVIGAGHSASFGASLVVGAFAPASLACPVDLCDVRVYASALTPAQIAADYFDAVPPPGAVAVWPFDDGAALTARETVGGAAVVLSGGAAFSSDSPMIARGCVRNVVAYSGRPDLSPWVSAEVTFGPYAGPLPTSGVTLSDIRVLTDTATNGLHYAAQYCGNSIIRPGVMYEVSSYVRKVAGNDWCLQAFNSGNTVSCFNLATGAIGSTAAIVGAPNVEDHGNGWWRVSFMAKATDVGAGVVQFYMANSNLATSYAGGANQLAFADMLIAEAAPGQTTPSPAVPTGPAPLSVYGTRETRQNLLLASENLLSAVWSDYANALDAVTYNVLAANQNSVQFLSVTPGATYTISFFAKRGSFVGALQTGVKDQTHGAFVSTLADYYAGLNGSSLTRTKVTFTVPAGCTQIAFYAAYAAVVTTPGTVTLTRFSMSQTSDVSDYVATRGAYANANGAPRSISTARALSSGRALS